MAVVASVPPLLKGAVLVRAFRQQSDRLDLTISEISALAGCSPVVVCALRGRGLVPKRRPTLRRLARFIERVSKANDRESLGLLP
jgi:hypothetical protein